MPDFAVPGYHEEVIHTEDVQVLQAGGGEGWYLSPGVTVVGAVDDAIVADGVALLGVQHADAPEGDVGGDIGLLALPGIAAVAGELDLAVGAGHPTGVAVDAVDAIILA